MKIHHECTKRYAHTVNSRILRREVKNAVKCHTKSKMIIKYDDSRVELLTKANPR